MIVLALIIIYWHNFQILSNNAILIITYEHNFYNQSNFSKTSLLTVAWMMGQYNQFALWHIDTVHLPKEKCVRITVKAYIKILAMAWAVSPFMTAIWRGTEKHCHRNFEINHLISINEDFILAIWHSYYLWKMCVILLE